MRRRERMVKMPPLDGTMCKAEVLEVDKCMMPDCGKTYITLVVIGTPSSAEVCGEEQAAGGWNLRIGAECARQWAEERPGEGREERAGNWRTGTYGPSCVAAPRRRVHGVHNGGVKSSGEETPRCRNNQRQRTVQEKENRQALETAYRAELQYHSAAVMESIK
ncbi:hypothetical protein CRUP_012294, partial [Coryphaenoides rupestris]